MPNSLSLKDILRSLTDIEKHANTLPSSKSHFLLRECLRQLKPIGDTKENVVEKMKIVDYCKKVKIKICQKELEEFIDTIDQLEKDILEYIDNKSDEANRIISLRLHNSLKNLQFLKDCNGTGLQTIAVKRQTIRLLEFWKTII